MTIQHLQFEISPNCIREGDSMNDHEDINDKYDKGYSRVITENGSYKISIIPNIFSQNNYNLHPEYQRRITWNSKKRSKLIESLIINIPIPPIFLYEYDYDKYEIMDGLQRITAIIDFYENKYKLTGLEEWSELNGKTYKNLPEKIKEGIDRRQLQVITLLKESANNDERAEKIRRLVFERLNTGGVKLQGQEIRNAIYNGRGNKMCFELSQNTIFRKLWNIPTDVTDCENDEIELYEAQSLQTIDDEKLRKKLERHSLYKRMSDVELVLRYFAMRYVDDFNYSLSEFLDNTLITLNTYTYEQLLELKKEFLSALDKANTLFGEYAFKFYDGEKWSSPSKMIYDPLMQALTKPCNISSNCVEDNIEKLQNFYSYNLKTRVAHIENSENTSEENGNKDDLLFDGKHQSKDDINKRIEEFTKFLEKL